MRFLSFVLLASLWVGTASAEPSGVDLQSPANLKSRVEALLRVDADDSVKRPLELARAALQRAEAANGASKARVEELARVAVELAEARLRVLRERTLLRAAEQRRAVSFAEKETARRALERERNRALQLERAP